jgi:ring-1,2-phenylacetyl-CoA epoxidase subunit PaaE
MSGHFYPLKVLNVVHETEDCISVQFEIPKEFESEFYYLPGQHLTLRAEIGGKEVRRNYSLCSSPLDGAWRIAIKKLPGGLFSCWAHQHLVPGVVVDSLPPMGRFTLPPGNNQTRHWVAVAAGSGITPILSMISTALRSEPNCSITLIYANRTKQHIIFKEELEALKNKFMHRFRVFHVLSREKTDAPLFHGRITSQKFESFLTSFLAASQIDECFLCGPEEMIHACSETLLQHGLPKQHIHFELFTAGRYPIETLQNAPNSAISHIAASIVLKSDGIESRFDLAYDGESILEAALRRGIDLPFACKGGVCCTCKARLLQGVVHMDVVYGLEPEEIQAGYILTCQSHPRSPQLQVDFDS